MRYIAFVHISDIKIIATTEPGQRDLEQLWPVAPAKKFLQIVIFSAEVGAGSNPIQQQRTNGNRSATVSVIQEFDQVDARSGAPTSRESAMTIENSIYCVG